MSRAQIPTVRERIHRQRLGRTTPNVQEHKWWSYAVGKRDSLCLVKNTAVSELGCAEAELYAQTTGISEGMVTKHLLKELGYDVTLVNHVDSQSAKAWASKRGLGRMKHIMLKCMFVHDVVRI